MTPLGRLGILIPLFKWRINIQQRFIHPKIMRKLLLVPVITALCGFSLTLVHADTELTQWTITADSLMHTNPGVSNFVSGFTATELSFGTNIYTANTNLTPPNTWYALYTNSPFSIPTTGLRAVSIGRYFTFDTVISAGSDIEVDAISGLILGKSSSTATNAALYYSTNDGTSWLQAGGTAYLPLSAPTQDYSSEINTGEGTNTYGATTITNLGLTTSPIDFNNSTNSSDETVKWALTFWGGGNGRVGIGNGGNELSLSGVVVPEPSTYALFGLGALALLFAFRRKA